MDSHAVGGSSRAIVDFASDADPVSGRVVTVDGEEGSSGWMELIQILEQIRTGSGHDGTRG
ncbi:hypothetical protein ABZX69_39290 [Streptomyces sp. NPDC004074]|uniref:hypothetical protein n=1 Tax=unclassified Streptomyces TaxID=2593676 RepID=UPI0033BE78D1